jgi:hypothetical protein
VALDFLLEMLFQGVEKLPADHFKILEKMWYSVNNNNKLDKF